MSTPAEMLLRRLRQQAPIEGFKVSLAGRCAELHLHRRARALPDPTTVVAFFAALSGSTCDLITIHVGTEVAQVHQLIDSKRRWRTSTVEPAEEAA